MTQPTIDEIRAKFRYDPETGLIYLYESKQSGFDVTKPIGQRSRGYLRVGIGKNNMMAHRVGWALYYGNWPDGFLDHKDRNKSNNRIDNLRIATRSQNQANVVGNNASGRKGVQLHRGRYSALIRLNGKETYLGSFYTLDEAAHAYNKAAIALHGDFAVLNPIGVDYE